MLKSAGLRPLDVNILDDAVVAKDAPQLFLGYVALQIASVKGSSGPWIWFVTGMGASWLCTF